MPHAIDHVLQIFEPATGGVPEYVSVLSEGLVQRGWRVTVLARPNNSAMERLTACGASVVEVDMTKWPSARTVSVVRTAIRQARTDVSIVHGHSTAASFLAAMASRATGLPSVYSPHFWAFDRHTHPLLSYSTALYERWMGRIHRHIIAVAEREQRSAERVHIPTAVTVIRTGLPDEPPRIGRSEARALLGIAPHVPVALWIGRRAAQKRPQDLAPIATRLRAAHIEFIAVGYGLPGSADGEAFIEAGGHLLPTDDTAVLYAAADIFVQTSAWESTPLTILEAMRAGLPVVAYQVGGVEGQVTNGVTGYLIGQGDHDGLAARVIALASSQPHRDHLGKAARQRYEQLFPLAGMIEAVEDVYRRVVLEDPRQSDRHAPHSTSSANR